MDRPIKPRRDDDKKPRTRKTSDSKSKSSGKNERSGKPFKVRSTSDYSESKPAIKKEGNFDKFRKKPERSERSDSGDRRDASKGRNPKPYPKKEFGGDERRPFKDKPYSERKPFNGDRAAKDGNSFSDRRSSASDRKPFSENKFPKSDKPYADRKSNPDFKKPYGDKPFRESKPFEEGSKSKTDRPFSDRKFENKKSFGDKPYKERKPFSDRSNEQGDRPFTDRKSSEERSPREERPYSKRTEKSFDDSAKKPKSSYTEYKSKSDRSSKTEGISRSIGNTERRIEKPKEENKKDSKTTYNQQKAEKGASKESPNEIYEKIEFSGWEEYEEKTLAPEKKTVRDEDDLSEPRPKRAKRLKDESTEIPYERKPLKKAVIPETIKKREKTFADDGLIRLNRFIANSGVCSRRKADELIEEGMVTVNGEVVKELGYKVEPTDKITFNGKLLKREKLVYVLLNKPKDYITTMDDPMERRTVMELIKNTTNERVYPVGRLDRNTTGLLLLTNDGDLADILSHPRNKVRKLYEVELDKMLSPSDFDLVKKGVELEDGVATVDELSYVEGKSKKHIGIEIHIGRNRIVRRIFESLGYTVERLDRVIYAGLTKRDLTRGRCRFLTQEEVIHLKHLNTY